MDAFDSSKLSLASMAFFGLVAAIVISYFVYMMMCRSNTMPSVKATEGFYGAPVVGAGDPNCMRDSSEAAAIVGLFMDSAQTAEEGSPDLQELKVLLGKLACMKRDLIQVSGVVNATLYSPFSTAHDVEPVAETVGRCFAKTIPPRDLEISFDKWKARGRFLIRRLCSAYNLDEGSAKKAMSLFDAVLVDVYDVAQQKCFKGEAEIMGKISPRDVSPFTPPTLVEMRDYTGYY